MSSKEEAATRLPHPIFNLISRYGSIIRVSWRMRSELAGPQRLADERAFLPAALALQEQPPHPSPRRAAIAICMLFLVALIWAVLGRLDIVAIAPGRIVVSDKTKIIQPFEASVIKAIHVRDGDRVVAGQVLVELDATLIQADGSRVSQELESARSEKIRSATLLEALRRGDLPSIGADPNMSTSLMGATRLQIASEWNDIKAKLAKLRAEIDRRKAEVVTAEALVAKLSSTLPMAQARERDFAALSTQGFVTGHAGQDRTRERVELERDLLLAQARLRESQASVVESQQGQLAYTAEVQRNLRDREAQAALKEGQLLEESAKVRRRHSLTRLTAPMSGTVQQLAIHTIGGVVTPAQALLVLVPDDRDVTAEVAIENKDVGFVREGQTVEIKLDTFPFTRYGTLPGKVLSISADAVQDEKRGAIFPAVVILSRKTIDIEGKKIHLAPGMNLTAEIKTGKRRVIDYLLSPVQQRTGESLRER